MKLLWVFSTFSIGGPQRRAATLMERLGPDYSHVIVALDGRWEAERFLPANGSWRKREVGLEKSGLVSLSNLRRIGAALRDASPNLLLTSNWGAIEWAIANRGRIPHIHFEDGFGADESPGRQNVRRVIARRLFLGRSICAVPSHMLERLALEVWRLPKGNVVRIPNGIDVRRFGSAQQAKESERVVVGSLGALRREKNYRRLVRAAAAAQRSVAELRVELFGEGDERAAIIAEAEKSGFADRLLVQGFSTTPEAALAGFDIFALSSDTEQMPLSLMEAMAAGLPVAATDVGDIAGMVSDANRPFIAPAHDEPALAAAIAALARDPALRRTLGAANAAKARAEFGVETMVAAHRALYARVASRR
jgi:glycosyltransferase involved in cell wall biosynthesis